MRSSKTPNFEHLRPASPPKTNPWTTKRPADNLSPDWPSITPDFANINCHASRKTSNTIKDKQEAKNDGQESWSAKDLASAPSQPSRKESHQAAPRAGNSLWIRPFGADILVRIGPEIYQVHRSIVEPQSAFFRQHLPPKTEELTTIEIRLDLSPETVANTLRFMYTKTLEVCDYDREAPRDLIHLPRSALLYIGATALGVNEMKEKVLQVLEQTAKDLSTYFQGNLFAADMTQREVETGVAHLRNAIYVVYSYEHLGDMVSLRLAFARVFDTLLPVLMRHRVVVDELFSSCIWRKHADSISIDILAARNPLKLPRRKSGSKNGHRGDEK